MILSETSRLKPIAARVLAEADAGGDFRVRADRGSGLTGDQTQGAEVAGGVAGGEELFGIGPVAALAAHLGRDGQADVDLAVVGGGAAFVAAASRSCGVGAVQDFHQVTPLAIQGVGYGAQSFRNNGSVIRVIHKAVLTICP